MHLSELIRQKSYERIEYLLRRHPITFISTAFLFVVLFSVPIVLYLMIQNLFPTLFDDMAAYALVVLLGSVYYLSTYLFFYAGFLDFYLDMWIVTNDRIIDIEQFGLFARTTTELDLYRIQDVTVHMNGLFPTFLNYGDILVKTASSNMDIIFKSVKHPNDVRERLIKLSDADRKYHTDA